MSRQKPSFFILFVAFFMLVICAVLLLFLSALTIFLVRDPSNIQSVSGFILSSFPHSTLYHFYDNFILVLALITAFGLFLLKRWAYRFLLLILICRLIESSALLFYSHFVLYAPGALLVGWMGPAIYFLVLLLAMRESIREQFQFDALNISESLSAKLSKPLEEDAPQEKKDMGPSEKSKSKNSLKNKPSDAATPTPPETNKSDESIDIPKPKQGKDATAPPPDSSKKKLFPELAGEDDKDAPADDIHIPPPSKGKAPEEKSSD